MDAFLGFSKLRPFLSVMIETNIIATMRGPKCKINIEVWTDKSTSIKIKAKIIPTDNLILFFIVMVY